MKVAGGSLILNACQYFFSKFVAFGWRTVYEKKSASLVSVEKIKAAESDHSFRLAIQIIMQEERKKNTILATFLFRTFFHGHVKKEEKDLVKNFKYFLTNMRNTFFTFFLNNNVCSFLSLLEQSHTKPLSVCSYHLKSSEVFISKKASQGLLRCGRSKNNRDKFLMCGIFFVTRSSRTHF